MAWSLWADKGWDGGWLAGWRLGPEGPYTLPLWNSAPKTTIGMVFRYLIP